MNIKLDPVKGIPTLSAEAETIKRTAGAKALCLFSSICGTTEVMP